MVYFILALGLASAVAAAPALDADLGAASADLACKGQGRSLALPYPADDPAGWAHDRFVTEPRDGLFDGGAFVSAFPAPDAQAGPQRAVPLWVAYEMRALLDPTGRAQRPKGARRPANWYELKETSPLWTSHPGLRAGLDPAYRGVGEVWNRGHLAARVHANRIGWQAGCNTHVFVNALPQHARLNQGDWEALENYAAALANRRGRVWTVAGPVFDPAGPVATIGDEREVKIAVPNAVFKVLAVETGDGVDVRAFVFPQDEQAVGRYRRCSGTPQEAYDYSPYATTLTAIEQATGLRLFTRLDAAARAALDARATLPPWPVDADDYPVRCGGHDATSRAE